MTSADRRRLYDTYAKSRNHPAASITTNTATARNRPTQFGFFSLFCSLLSFFFKSVCSMFYLYEAGAHFMIHGFTNQEISRHKLRINSYSSQLFTVLGNGMTSRMLPIPVRYITHLSNPSPNPACLAEPYLRRSR